MEKPNVEILEAVLREGLYWAYLGRPKEVMPFLRGKLKVIANGSFEVVDEVLRELEQFYEEVSRMDRITQKEFRRLRIYRDMLFNALGV
ncbi:hypothetical protein A3L04_06620 [Thermococcus chitonophagus]|uniref:Uncharacterized protein n=1 Tax=Thermococcus chitonophagus TaxID=54262 RepID=A0A160VWF5_9EURY|nr:hypothetical protein [Thermococcus chitonophagus]ASJ16770.1 hypothetical protein A3L04_06620 [Thermococcus chitonophagus]CUX78241.1 hypothetical protein CHITON_1462 [Thermococcus chitonophagus]